jgi:hypothetical protein
MVEASRDLIPIAPIVPVKERAMVTIRLHETTIATPEQFLAGLTDFGPGRSKIFPNSADGYLEVHDQGPSSADVTEGSNGVWERRTTTGPTPATSR